MFATVADDIYMTISGGERHYYITVNDEKVDAEEWLNKNGITAKEKEETTQQQTNEDSQPHTNEGDFVDVTQREEEEEMDDDYEATNNEEMIDSEETNYEEGE